MDLERLRAELDRALAGRHLLSHPFYLRWEAGELGADELHAYAGQYRHFEATLPRVLRRILGVYESQVAIGGAAGLAAVAAYEIQAPDVAKAKFEGLRAHYGLDADGATFWRIHGQLDENHARWITEALAAVAEDPGQVGASARSAAEAWWSFLDEREQQMSIAS
jgi:pyrroloquinoline quinone (PQQ) biosynthesis protein C